ncbi:MAG: NADH-quinone oxidoreductase subunit M [Polyangia bacterium]
MLLILTTFLPLAGALLLLMIPKEEVGLLKGTAFTISTLTFIVSLFLLGLEPTGFSHVVDVPWVEPLGMRFHLGIDGISLWLILLTTFLMPIVIASSWFSIDKKVREFVIALLVLETGMLGTFAALDLFFFYIFWEVMLIPMYLLIGIWGGERRLYASIKFVLYTMVGSLLMIVAILYLYVQNHALTQVWTFDYDTLRQVVLPHGPQLLCFLAFALAFCIKVPLFPFHTWLPDAHVEAPTAGSVILASVMLKFGGYGLLRFAFPMFPWAAGVVAPYLSILAVIGILYGSLVAFAQTDMKKLIAYSSVAHLGFVVLGISMWTQKSIDGAVYQMLAHGITTGGLFLCVGILYVRRHTRRIDEYGGLAGVMPKFLGAFLILTMASIGLPLLSGFIGEFLILLGSFGAYATWVDLPIFFPHPKLLVGMATIGVILAAVYMLFLFQKLMFGPNDNPKNKSLLDLTPREIAYLVPVILMAFWLGCYPTTFLSGIDPAVSQTMAQFKTKWGQSNEEVSTARLMASGPQDPDAADRNVKTIEIAPGVMAPAPTQAE